MTPSASETVAKVANAAAGTHSAAKDFKKESAAARFLGAGTTKNGFKLNLPLKLGRNGWHCGADGLPSC